jgi:hypothetical protein
MDMPATSFRFAQGPACFLSGADLLFFDQFDSKQNLAVPMKSMLDPLNHCLKNLGTVGALEGMGALHFRQFV